MAQPADWDWETSLLAALDAYERKQDPGARGFLSALPGFFGLSSGRDKAAARFGIEDPVRQAAASLVVFGFAGTEVNSHARRMIGLGAGGVILFARNYSTPEQVATLCAELKAAAAPRRLLIMIDQEGGRVVRLGPPFSTVPCARAIGQAGEVSLGEAAGRVIGRELRAVNIDMDLAPVADVDTNPKNPVIADRAFGRSSGEVSAMAAAFARGLEQEGVAACAKHFPGHGDTSIDSHLSLPLLPHSLERLREVELAPFQALAAQGIAAVMVAHLWTPALEAAQLQTATVHSSDSASTESTSKSATGPIRGTRSAIHSAEQSTTESARESGAECRQEPEAGAQESDRGDPRKDVSEKEGGSRPCALGAPTPVPASLSRGPIEYLRRAIGYKGVVVTDDMEMGAVVKHWPIAEATVRAVGAGVDLVLVCHTEKEQVRAMEALRDAIAAQVLPLERVRDALGKVFDLSRKYCLPGGGDSRLEVVGCKDHQHVVDEINHLAAAKALRR